MTAIFVMQAFAYCEKGTDLFMGQIERFWPLGAHPEGLLWIEIGHSWTASIDRNQSSATWHNCFMTR